MIQRRFHRQRGSTANSILLPQKRVPMQQKRQQCHANFKMATSQPLLESNALMIHRLSSLPTTLEKLKHKHPPEHNEIHVPPSRDGIPVRQDPEDKVLGAIKSFPAGSVAGPDGIRPHHLLGLVQSQILVYLFLSPPSPTCT